MRFLPVTIDTYPDFVQLFEGRGGPKFCWCMVNRPMEPQYGKTDNATKKHAISNYVSGGTPIGVLAYVDGEPVGWCSIAPMATYKNLRGAKYVSDGDDIEDVWSIACFFIRTDHRRDGLTTPLIEAAIDYAKANGAKMVEAYPVDYDSPSYSYMGRIGTFERLGFEEAGMVGIRRHIMRFNV